MKIIKRFLKSLLIFGLILILPFSVRADDVNIAVKTGDGGIIGIAVAFVAFIATAYITMRLTKYKNKNKNNK